MGYNPPKGKKIHLSLDPAIYEELCRQAKVESRTRSGQVSWLILERARSLDLRMEAADGDR